MCAVGIEVCAGPGVWMSEDNLVSSLVALVLGLKHGFSGLAAVLCKID